MSGKRLIMCGAIVVLLLSLLTVEVIYIFRDRAPQEMKEFVLYQKSGDLVEDIDSIEVPDIDFRPGVTGSYVHIDYGNYTDLSKYSKIGYLSVADVSADMLDIDGLAVQSLCLENVQGLDLGRFETGLIQTVDFEGYLSDGLENLNLCENLDTICFYDIQLDNPNFLRGLENIEFLSFDGCTINDCSVVASMKQIKELTMRDCGLSDASFLKNSEIESLVLDGNELTDISFAGTIDGLKSLDASDNNIEGEVAIRNMPTLHTLDLGGNYITDFTAGKGLDELSDLNLSENCIEGSVVIENLPKLSFLTLNKNEITHISFGDEVEKLVNLNLSENRLSGEFEIDLPLLTYLQIEKNDITALVPSRRTREISTICAEGNRIGGVFDLSKFPGLNYLYLEFNEITDIKGDFSNINFLDLSYNKITTVNEALLKALNDEKEHLNVDLFGNYFDDPSQLKDMTNVMYFDENEVSFEYDEHTAYINKVKEVVEKYVDDSWSEEKKAIAVYDYICRTALYDHEGLEKHEAMESLDRTHHTEYGALVKELAVCDGFSYAYRDILDYLGIEAYVYMGDAITKEDNANHAWNIVKIDGKYYHMDVTWDLDIAKTQDYLSYFGLSDAEMAEKEHYLEHERMPACNESMDMGHIMDLLAETREYAGIGKEEIQDEFYSEGSVEYVY